MIAQLRARGALRAQACVLKVKRALATQVDLRALLPTELGQFTRRSSRLSRCLLHNGVKRQQQVLLRRARRAKKIGDFALLTFYAQVNA